MIDWSVRFVTRDSLATKIAICEGMMRLCDVLLTSKHGVKEFFILRRGYEEKLRRLRAELERREENGGVH